MEQYPPLALSFGQQKRVSIAAILAMRSKILVMDEPTAGQDYKNYMEFMDAILQMPGFQAVVFITHDIDLAVIYANRVLLVNQGRVFTLAGGDITLVSQYGNIDAGKGAKTASSAPPPLITVDGNGNIEVDVSNSISGIL